MSLQQHRPAPIVAARQQLWNTRGCQHGGVGPGEGRDVGDIGVIQRETMLPIESGTRVE